MKFNFRPSPNYRNDQSTPAIMRDLTACLLAVLTWSIVWYSISYGVSYGIRIALMALTSVVTVEVTEALWFKALGKDWKEIKHSYGWITALIMVMIVRVDVSIYAIIMGSIVAIVFGKLVFGGFGQNFFNPAALGAATIMTSFASSVAEDVVTGPSPMANASSLGWMLHSAEMNRFLSQFGGFKGIILGNYPSVIGGSCALLLIVILIFMIWKKDIDWRLSITYLVSVFVIATGVGLVKGAGFEFGLFNVLTGGVLFGAVFMLTDPVTTPVTIPARVAFATGAAALTLLIRWKANLPDGVLFSILLMNMLSPAIDHLFHGNQIKDADRFKKQIVGIAVFSFAICLAAAMTLTPADDKAVEEQVKVTEAFYAETCEATAENTYGCKLDGFAGELTATIEVKDGAVVAITSLEGADNDNHTPDNDYFAAGALDIYKGATGSVDVITGATATGNAINEMVESALKAAK